MNNYNLEYIDKLRIHELRDYAKKIGVSSPTTMKKNELICEITSILDNKDFDKFGNKINIQEDLDFFELLSVDNSSVLEELLSKDKSNENTILMKKNNSYNDIKSLDEVFTFKLRQNEAEYGNNNVCSVKGYVDIHPNGYGILRYDGFVPSDKDSYFTSSLLKKHNLKKGQFIVGNSKYIIEGKPRVVFEITKVQEKNLIKNSKDFEEIEHNGLGDVLHLEKFELDLKKGERQYIENMQLDDAVSLGLDIVEENSSYVKFINIKAKPEEYYKTNGKLEIINVPFNKNEIEVINTVDLVFERVKREFELNKSNVIIIYNFSEFIRMVNVAFEGCLDFSKFNAKAINKIYNILYIAKYLDDNANSSLLCIDKNGIPRDISSIMELEFIQLFNKVNNTINKK